MNADHLQQPNGGEKQTWSGLYTQRKACTSRHRAFLLSPDRGTPEDVGVNRYVAGLEVDDAATHGDRHRLCAVGGVELQHDVLQVGLDCFFGNEQTQCDVLIAIAVGDES